jgi:hypothetical protein
MDLPFLCVNAIRLWRLFHKTKGIIQQPLTIPYTSNTAVSPLYQGNVVPSLQLSVSALSKILQKLIVAELVKKFPAVYIIHSFMSINYTLERKHVFYSNHIDNPSHPIVLIWILSIHTYYFIFHDMFRFQKIILK